MNQESSTPVLFCALGILGAFFLPWVQLFGYGVSGYNLGSFGSYGNYAWIIPILAGGTILVSFSGGNNRLLGALTGIAPLGALGYALIRLGNEAPPDVTEGALKVAHILSIGFYLTIIFSIAIVIAACSPKSSHRATKEEVGSLRSETSVPEVAEQLLGIVNRFSDLEIGAERAVGEWAERKAESLWNRPGGATPGRPRFQPARDTSNPGARESEHLLRGRSNEPTEPSVKNSADAVICLPERHQFCGECGSKQEQDSRFCTDCGAVL